VSLAPGRSTIVRFRLDAGDLGFWTHDTSGQFELEAGDIDIYVGSSSLTTARTTLTID
jgi:beta-glucosidase